MRSIKTMWQKLELALILFALVVHLGPAAMAHSQDLLLQRFSGVGAESESVVTRFVSGQELNQNGLGSVSAWESFMGVQAGNRWRFDMGAWTASSSYALFVSPQGLKLMVGHDGSRVQWAVVVTPDATAYQMASVMESVIQVSDRIVDVPLDELLPSKILNKYETTNNTIDRTVSYPDGGLGARKMTWESAQHPFIVFHIYTFPEQPEQPELHLAMSFISTPGSGRYIDGREGVKVYTDKRDVPFYFATQHMGKLAECGRVFGPSGSNGGAG